ncbi:MAG: hypothetical protein K8S23_11425 [Candidatus Cloacimonetes bacterium]|nr:hypothetical protein [Candidatus Cloacimonadota bacterium]
MKNLFLTFLFLTIGLLMDDNFIFANEKKYNFDPSKFSAETLEALKDSEKYNSIESKQTGYSGLESKSFKFHANLSKNASDIELVELTNHYLGSVRYYSLKELVSRKYDRKIIFDILKKHLNDTELITYISGCIVTRRKVGDSMLGLYGWDPIFTTEENRILDSLFFWNSDFTLNRQQRCYDKMAKSEKNYQRLKLLVYQEDNIYAYFPLIKYGYQEDMILISKLMKSKPEIAFEAIQLFPEEQFLKDLEIWQINELHRNSLIHDIWKKFYDTLRKFDIEQTEKFYLLPLNEDFSKNKSIFPAEYSISYIFSLNDKNLNYKFLKLYKDSNNVYKESKLGKYLREELKKRDLID